MPVQPDGPAPYAPASAVIDVVQQHRARGLPSPITTEVIGRAGVTDALAARVMKTLTLFDLVDGDGQETKQFSELAKAPESDFKDRFAYVLRAAYADVFQYVDPATDPVARIRDQFRHYQPRGQQERMVTLFMGLCEYVGIISADRENGTEPKRRAARPGNKSAAVKRAKTTKKPGETGLPRSPIPEDFQPTPPPASGQHPLIQGLLMALPPAGQVWPHRARENWTKAALANFELLYELPPEDQKGGE